ncbi:MAG: DUF6282 family protein [Alphaproteobacteria bacterium]
MLTQENFNSVIEDVMHGAIDMHVHFGPDMPPAPDIRVARRLDGLGIARQAREAGMRAIVIKSHHWPTGALAQTIQPLVPEVALFGTVVLNYSIGGLNPFAVEVAANIGCKVVFPPTWNSAYHVARHVPPSLVPVGLRGRPGLTVLDESGRLLPEMQEILDIVKAKDMVIATGHLSPREHLVLVEEAHRRGISRIVVSHVREEITTEERKQMADQGAVIELIYRPKMDPTAIIRSAQAIGVERCAMTVDGGQAFNAFAAEAYRVFVGQLLYHGMSPEDVKTIAQRTPARVLGLK